MSVTEFVLHPLDVSASTLRLRWETRPATSLYVRHDAALEFPPGVDLGALPPGLLERVALLCLHAHWPLLQPCVVRLPFRLAPGEEGFWRRLMAAQWDTLRAYGRDAPPEARIDLIGAGPELAPPRVCVDGDRCASAFSGGKDGFLQACLLDELAGKPLLVMTTSPMKWLEDHQHPKRRRIIEQLDRRKGWQVREVRSDFRSCWHNTDPIERGLHPSVNEVTDTFLYFAALWVTAAALGARHLFLASENEVQQNAEVGGRIVQHPHGMYAQAIQQAVRALVAPWGFTYGSLTSSLHSGQIQGLLWRRYREVRDLQFSCWSTTMASDMCNRCSQCLRISLCALAGGHDPAEMGADLTTILRETADWVPLTVALRDPAALPGPVTRARLHAQVLQYVREIGPMRMAAYLARQARARGSVRPAWAAWRAFLRLWRCARRESEPGWRGFRPGYLEHLDPVMREPLRRLLSQEFPAEPADAYVAALDRTRRLTDWIVAPLKDTATCDAVMATERGGHNV